MERQLSGFPKIIFFKLCKYNLVLLRGGEKKLYRGPAELLLETLPVYINPKYTPKLFRPGPRLGQLTTLPNFLISSGIIFRIPRHRTFYIRIV